jgi:ribonuclease R
MSHMEAKIMEALRSDRYRPIMPQELARKLRVSKKDNNEFRTVLQKLTETGVLRVGKKGRIRLKPSAGFIAGVVRKIASGAGFVIPSEKTPELKSADVYVSARDLRDAQTGDEVLVRLTSKRRAGGKRCGVIEKVVERASNVFVGTYFERGDQGFVRVDGTVFNEAVHVGDPGAKGAVTDDKVVIEMLRFPSASHMGEAVLTEVLGKRGDPGVDTLSVIHSLGLPHQFEESVLEDARTQAENFDPAQLEDREDLTKETIITIDPADARDFDDAISLRRSRDGHWHLGVHIADVAHFVVPDSPLDREARRRGTSVYLPRHVIPMLPEVISNGLASLQQGQVRFTKSVFIEFDADGGVRGASVANSAIKVTRRFAYEEVMPIIRNPRQQVANVTAKVRQLLERMHELAMLLRRRRFARGALQMGIPEVEIDFDKQGDVTGAHEKHHDESHEIIEEFMLAANIAVATLLSSKDIPFLRRVHGEPDELKLRAFREFCQGLGYELQHFQSRAEIQHVIDSVAGQPEERAINFALLRSMKQAEYSPEEFGHYALSEEDYCHFTSPIRRYPDLTLHRLIGDIAAGRSPGMDSVAELMQLGKSCSNTERRAEKAERELIRIKLLRYMERHVGDEMDALITGVENFGLFCQCVTIPAEGLIHSSALVDDFYVFNQSHRTLTGERTKRVFRLGDHVRVVIARVDIDRRQLDMRLADSQPQGSRSTRTRPQKKAASQSETTGRGKRKARGQGGQPSASGTRNKRPDQPSATKKKKEQKRRKSAKRGKRK